MSMTLDELKKQAEKTEGPVCDPCQGEKKTTLLLPESTETRVLPRLPSHDIGATRPRFGFIPGVHSYNIFGTPLHVVVGPDGKAFYAPLYVRPDGHLGAVTGDC